MTKILVVDDSRMDQHLVGSLLEPLDGAAVAYAENGNAALTSMERDVPDLVLTDLQMPGMNGLELVEAIRRDFTGVPVVLMTAHGSEEIAATALRRGASSYVPKRNLAGDLVRTVRRVLEVAKAQREHALFGCLMEARSRFVLDNNPALVKPLIAYLREQLACREFCDETGLMQVAMALDEAIVNAMHHGNLEVDSALREVGMEVYFAQVQERRKAQPWCERRVHITTWLTPEETVYVIRDEGKGFDPSTLPDPRDPANLGKASGRGLFLIQAFMDSIKHNETGNELMMTKRRES